MSTPSPSLSIPISTTMPPMGQFVLSAESTLVWIRELSPSEPVGPSAPMGPASPDAPTGPCGPEMFPRSIHSDPLQTWICTVELTMKASPASPMYISPRSEVSSTIPIIENEVPSSPSAPAAPAGPAGPTSPSAPAAPAGPAGPAGPTSPSAPAAPTAP